MLLVSYDGGRTWTRAEINSINGAAIASLVKSLNGDVAHLGGIMLKWEA